MQERAFGIFGKVSALTLGGGGIGQVWGKTNRDEAVATVHEAVAAGITLFDMAPLYGNGEAEIVLGNALASQPNRDLQITTKCRIGNIPPDLVYPTLKESLTASMGRLRVNQIDLLFLHNHIVRSEQELADNFSPINLVKGSVIPAFNRLREEGLIKGWGLTAIGERSAMLELLDGGTFPDAIQGIANLLDSAGGLHRTNESQKPREIIEAATRAGIPVMGIRAVQAGSLTDSLDRPKPPDDPESRDFIRAAPFRKIAKDIGQSAAFLAHQYSLSIDGVSTVVLGVKNRTELRECISAEDAGPMDPDLICAIDEAIRRT